MKERVTLTIDQDLLKKVDATVDGETVKNRSHAVELLLRKVLRGKVPQTAVILAGGKPHNPNVKDRPQSLVEISGQPIIMHNIDLLKRFGITDIIITLSHLSEMIRNRLGDGRDLGIRLTYLEEPQPLGTAGALRLLKGKLTGPFLVLNADELKDIDLAKMYDAHNRYEATVTIALTTTADPSFYGTAMLDGNKIMRFIEKPSKGDAQSRLINAGCYIIEPEALEVIPEGFAMLEQDVFPKLAREGHLYGYPFSGQWFDIDDDTRLKNAGKEWKGFTHLDSE